jgi:hypothetical protein
MSELMFAELYTNRGLLICFLASSIFYVTMTSFYDLVSHSLKRVCMYVYLYDRLEDEKM